MSLRLNPSSAPLLFVTEENTSSSESTASEVKEFPMHELKLKKPLTPVPSPLTERKFTTPTPSSSEVKEFSTLNIRPDEELQLAIAKAREFARKAAPLTSKSLKESTRELEKKEKAPSIELKDTPPSRAPARETKAPTAPSIELEDSEKSDEPSEDVPMAVDTKSLFNDTVVKLGRELEPIMKDASDESAQKADEIIKKSNLYARLKELSAEQDLAKKDLLLLTILELNEYCARFPYDQGTMTIAVLGSLRLLFKEGAWQLAYGDLFFEQLYHMHSLRFGNKGVTPVLEVIDRGMAAEYLSPKSQKFMDDATYDGQFEPITEILMKADGDISDPKTKAAIAAVADNLFTTVVKKNDFVMRKKLYKAPIQGIPLINRTGLAKGLAGAGEFRQIAIRHKYNYMKDYRALHLSYIAKAKKEHLEKGSAMRYFEKKATFSGQACTVAFAGVGEPKKTTIKAISITSYEAEDVYFFVEELVEKDPKAHPNPDIPLMDRSLYKFELIPGTPFIRLQRASYEAREGILKMIEEIKNESKIDVACAVKTAIWHLKELMPVEIIRQCGSMFSVRVLYGAIKTYVKNLPRPSKGDLSNPFAFKNFKRKLREVLIGSQVLVMNDILASWHQDDLYDHLISESTSGITETAVMKIIKKSTLEVFNQHKHPGKHLLKSIMSCCYDGDPQALTSEK